MFGSDEWEWGVYRPRWVELMGIRFKVWVVSYKYNWSINGQNEYKWGFYNVIWMAIMFLWPQTRLAPGMDTKVAKRLLMTANGLGAEQCGTNIWIFEYIRIYLDEYIHSSIYLLIFFKANIFGYSFVIYLCWRIYSDIHSSDIYDSKYIFEFSMFPKNV